MILRRWFPRLALCVLGFVSFASARADDYAFTGNFTADNSVAEFLVGTTTSQSFTFSTSSYAQGGFEPVLTLFNAATGVPTLFSNAGSGDASITGTLDAGNYDLFLTEYPNVASGNLSDGFLFGDDPTATGDVCNVSGGMFLDAGNSVSCAQLGSNFALSVSSASASTVTAVAATPEPSSLLLMLAPAAGMFWTARRRLNA